MKRKNIWAIAVTAASAILYSACNDSSTGADSNSDNGSSNNSPFYEKLSSDSKVDSADSGDGAKSSSSTKSSSSSSESTDASIESSSSIAGIESSSSIASIESSSSIQSSASSVSGVCGDLWCGYTDIDVHTGYEDKYETSGNWYMFDDQGSPDQGNSEISLNFDVEPLDYGSYVPVNIEEHGGIFGSVALGDAYMYPYAGIGFNIVSEDQQGADISDWGGVCLVYSSTVPFYVELGVENEKDVTEYNNYKASVAKSASLQVVDISWVKFKQESSWGITVAQGEILKKVAAIKIKFSLFSGDFYIVSLGRRGTCNKEVEAYDISVPTFSLTF